jgi:hypothetical protein
MEANGALAPISEASLIPNVPKYIPENRCGISSEIADKLTKAAQSARASVVGKQIKAPIGTRALMICAKAIKRGMKPERAIKTAIVNQVESTQPNERKALGDIFAAHFGASVA